MTEQHRATDRATDRAKQVRKARRRRAIFYLTPRGSLVQGGHICGRGRTPWRRFSLWPL